MSKLITKIFAASLKRLGYDFQINEKNFYKNKKFSYGLIKTTASYSPWQDDQEFLKVFEVIDGHTLVEYYRVYELWSVVGEVCKLPGEGAFIEVGVWRGGTCGIIGRKLELLGSKETLYAADTFTGVVKSSEKDSFYNDSEHADTDLSSVKKLLFEDLKLNNVVLLQGIFPDDTQELIPEGTKFRFCHIDVDVYKSAEGILQWVWDRLIVGGMVVFDDYGAITCDGITQFVNEQRVKKDRLYIYNVNGHAIFVKLY